MAEAGELHYYIVRNKRHLFILDIYHQEPQLSLLFGFACVHRYWLHCSRTFIKKKKDSIFSILFSLSWTRSIYSFTSPSLLIFLPLFIFSLRRSSPLAWPYTQSNTCRCPHRENKETACQQKAMYFTTEHRARALGNKNNSRAPPSVHSLLPSCSPFKVWCLFICFIGFFFFSLQTFCFLAVFSQTHPVQTYNKHVWV